MLYQFLLNNINHKLLKLNQQKTKWLKWVAIPLHYISHQKKIVSNKRSLWI